MTLTDANAYVGGCSHDDRSPNSEEQALWSYVNRSTVRLPEHNLMLALIEDGIDQALNGESSEERGEAWAWISDSDPEYVFSFENCCGALDLEAGYLRKGVRRIEEERHGNSILTIADLRDRFAFVCTSAGCEIASIGA